MRMGTRAVRKTPSGVGQGVGVALGVAVGGGGAAVGDGDGEGVWVATVGRGAGSVRVSGRVRVATALAVGIRVGRAVGLGVMEETSVGWTEAIHLPDKVVWGAGDVNPSWETAKRMSRIAKDQ
jgi:hypothetical protein